MNARMTQHEKTFKLTVLALLTALIIALQVMSNFISFGPISMTLALTPIIIGAAIYGPKTGALLGFLFSVVVYVTGLMGLDKGFVNLMMSYSALGTTVLCLLKGTLAGWVSGICYRALKKAPDTLRSITAAALTPIVNTGVFALGMLTIFYGFLAGNAAEGEDPIKMLFLAWIGVNFIVEFITNLVLGSVLTPVLSYFNKKYKSN